MDNVIIIGAPRSGTNVLRDMLIQLPGAGTWPCDEINYIWRHGNVRYSSDEFKPEMAQPFIQTYIRGQFQKLSAAYDLDTVVEKTCANSLRVGFVHKVVPNSKYIFIVRDGVDAVASSLKRWKASLDLPYILKKARYIPVSDIPYYASRYLLSHLHRVTSNEKRLSSWGPLLNDMDQLLKRYSLLQVCALQWKACLDNSERDFTNIPSAKILRIKYEDFVKDPVTEFAFLADFLDKEVPEHVNLYLTKNVRYTSVGKGRKELGEAGIKNIRPLIADTLERYGY